MDKTKQKALEDAGWKFGDAEDFFKEIIVNFDAAVRDSVTIARSLAARSEDYQKAACVLAAEVERLRGELAAAKAASVLPVKVKDCYAMFQDVEVECFCENECQHKNLFFWGDASLVGHYYCPDCRTEFPIEKIAEQLKKQTKR